MQWVLRSHMSHLSSHAPLARSHTSSYSSLMVLHPCPDHDSYNTVAEMIDCQTFLTVKMQILKERIQEL